MLEKQGEANACTYNALAYLKFTLFFLVDQLLLLLLDSESRDLVYVLCGIFINLTADPAYRSILSDNSGVEK